MFSGFMSGKLLDSTIIGVICYIFCLIARMPNALLVSAVIGVTNIIPVFGPYFGAVPMGLLILIESPPKCLVFVIFIVVLQQVDGNIIGPKILGNSTGLSGFSVLFAIVLFGGIFGFIGLIIGVPLYAVIYDIISKLVALGLKKHGREYLAENLEPKRFKAKKIYD
jgi:predicted PurR-regulated permease PerM